jgi:hypothetical protein
MVIRILFQVAQFAGIIDALGKIKLEFMFELVQLFQNLVLFFSKSLPASHSSLWP